MKNFADILKNFVLDLPYNVADIGYGIRKAVQPNIPFSEQDWGVQQDQQRMGAIKKPSFQNMLMDAADQNLYTPTAEASSEIAPLFLPPQTSDVSNTAAMLTQAGFRPRAVQYLSKIPIKVGLQYSPGKALGTSYNDIGFIGVKPGMQNDPTVMTHEFLHQTPRLLPMSFADLLSKQSETSRNEYTNRWGKGYMDRPDAMNEERFAEQDLNPLFYKHIFTQGNKKKNVSPPPLGSGWITGTTIGQ